MVADGPELMLPWRGLTPRQSVELAVWAQAHGWRGGWAAEVRAADALVLLGALAGATSLRLGTAIVPISTRSPAVLAMAAATLADLAPGRVTFGVGVSTPAIVTVRHARPVTRPVAESAALLAILRGALAGEVVSCSEPAISDLRIQPPAVRPRLVLAALGPRMTELAYAQADGLALNLTPFPVAAARAREAAVRAAAPGFQVNLQVRVAIDPTAAQRRALRREVAGYMRVPGYAAAFAELGPDLSAVRAAPDLDAAADRVDPQLMDQLVLWGEVDAVADGLAGLRAAGVRALVLPSAGAALARTPLERLVSTIEGDGDRETR